MTVSRILRGGWGADKGALKLVGEAIYKITLKQEWVGVGHDEMDIGKERKGVGC